MSNTLQEFLARGAQKAAEDMEAALLRLPEDKRNWSPMGDARTALDQVAEVAILNGGTVAMIQSKSFPDGFSMQQFMADKAKLSQNESALLELLHENTAKVVEAIRNVPDGDLGIEFNMPWGPMTMAQILSYPYWNACYHEGQINYLASMLGCLP